MLSLGISKPKKQVLTHGRWVRRMYFSSVGTSPSRRDGGQQLALQVARQVDFLSAVAERRAERVGRLRLGDAGQHGGVSDRAVVFLARG